MDEHNTTTMAAPGPTWQRWALYMARTGYSDLKLSAFMTAQRIHRAHAEPERTVPFVSLAALTVDAELALAGSSLITLPLTLAAAAD